MKSILSSAVVLLLVLFFWTLYHIKCTAFFLRIINSEEGRFLHGLQAASKRNQWWLYFSLYTIVYAPVLLYGFLVFAVGIQQGKVWNACVVLLFQFASIVFFTGLIFFRLNHWLEELRFPSFRLPFRKHLILLVLFHFTAERKQLLLVLKAVSLLLFYLVLVWNRGNYDNDAFMLFYLVVFLLHAALPYMAVQFIETKFSAIRNLPLSLLQRAMLYVLPYCLLLLPEFIYLFLNGTSVPMNHKIAYSINLLASLFLLTAIRYSEAQNRDEYMKATFAIFFVSIFFLHVEAFWFWIAAQFIAASILFASSFYAYEETEAE